MSAGAVISILVWDAPYYVENLLKSLFEEYRIGSTPHCVYVLDQGSGFATRRVLRRFRDRVRVIRLKRNIGFPKGHNLIFEEASTTEAFRYFCAVNSDVRFLEDDWLDRMVNVMEADRDVAVSGPVAVNIIDHGERLGHGSIAETADAAAGRFDFISGALCTVRRRVAEERGLFDEVFTPGYFEDADMVFRYLEAGYAQAWCPVKHEHGYLGKRATAERSRKRRELVSEYGAFQERNRHVFLDRWQEKQFMRTRHAVD
jgi:GT2 family glycosyltransferase